MFGWLRKHESNSTASQPPMSAAGRLPFGTAGRGAIGTAGSILNEMTAKGYRGPFATRCDGVNVLMFHGPAVSLNPLWLDQSQNPFHMRVFDCRSYCAGTLLYGYGPGAETIQRCMTSASARNAADRKSVV